MVKTLPILYGVSRIGKVKQWEASAQGNVDGSAAIMIQSGYVGGKIRTIPKLITKGKNIGKSNETTPFEQAVSQIESQWSGKRDQNYEPEQMDPNNYTPRLMLPQLAKGNRKGKIVFPAYMQPKLNGVCNLAETVANPLTNDVAMLHHSRGGHLFNTLANLDQWIHRINAPAPLHGELYKHGWSLQKIGSYTKKIKPDQEQLEFWLYDIAWIGPTYEERLEWMTSILNLIHRNFPECPIKLTPTILVNSYDEAKVAHDKWVQEGFEGGMLKNKKGIYMFQYNSNDLEKVKEFEDDEFEIVGGKEGVGADAGCIIYRCITESGLEFDARPRGTQERRREMLINLPNDIGKKLTVRFAEYSDVGIPLQPVGVPEAEAVRDYE